MIVPQTTADLVVDCACRLGEGPTWDAWREQLLWLDIDDQRLHRLDVDDVHSTTELDRRVTAVVPDADGGLVAAVDASVAHLDGSGAVGSIIATLPPAGDGVTNDGRCDPSGRLWIGTVDRSGSNRAGLFCVGSDGSVTVVRSGVGLSNGLDWSPDGRICHYVDSFARCIQNLHLGPDGLPVGADILVGIDATPDGLTVDAEGGIWVALWDGGEVHRYRPDGRLDRRVSVAGGFITSCAFGGPDGSTLYITTARDEMTPGDLVRQPHAGGLFAAEVGVTGRGYTAFAAHGHA